MTDSTSAVPPAARSSAERPWWSLPPGDVAERLDASPDRGLSAEEAARRRAAVGPNALREHVPRSVWDVLLSQFKSLIVGLLGAAALVAFLFGDTLEAGAILAVLVINTAIGFTTEWRAVRSMEALRQLGHVDARVRRDGSVHTLPAEDLVPGDVVLLDGGDVVTADLRLLTASRLRADESALTGESVPVDKAPDPVDPDAPLAERTAMLYKGTAVTRGTATAVVVGTGMDTELGDISELVETAESGSTPLEDRLAHLGRRLIGVTVLIIVAVTASGVLRGKELVLMIETGLALAVAAIPEGLPIVATIALARGMRRMAKRNALVRRLASVETLGATGIICTDKTGTLTENRMTLTRAAVPGPGETVVAAFDAGAWAVDEADADARLERLLDVAVLCTDAPLDAEGTPSGDAMDVALVRAADARGRPRDAVTDDFPQVGVEAFDTDVKMMATIHEAGSAYRVAVKGAPEAVLAAAERVATADGTEPLDDEARAAWHRRNEALAEEGLRVLGVAERPADTPDAPPYEGLIWLGLVGFTDPPRDDVRPALDECRAAGIEVVMMTGDQPVTARSIGRAVGLVEGDDAEVVHGADMPSFDAMDPDTRRRWRAVRLFARVTPRQKLDLIALHQGAGRVVAMTGDGVNDAPALKKADIGIAMGQRGTQVAQEAADMVLRDDAFSTIVAAVRQGRVIFRNIRRFVYYLLSCNVGEVVVVGLATLLGTTLPILPLQILFLNLVTDVFPALALGVGEGDATTMRRGPRHIDTPILTRRHWWEIAGYGGVFAGAVLGALLTAHHVLGMAPEAAVTVSFLTLALGQIWHVFNMRSPDASLFNNDVTRNRYVWGAVALCLALLAAAVHVPVLARVLDVTPLPLTAWGVVLGMSFVPLLIGQIGLWVQGRWR